MEQIWWKCQWGDLVPNWQEVSNRMSWKHRGRVEFMNYPENLIIVSSYLENLQTSQFLSHVRGLKSY